jgi:hypothetical protein
LHDLELRYALLDATTILGFSLGFIDSSVVNVALPKAQAEMGVGLEASQWVARPRNLA